jgi:hypothetical protein
VRGGGAGGTGIRTFDKMIKRLPVGCLVRVSGRLICLDEWRAVCKPLAALTLTIASPMV